MQAEAARVGARVEAVPGGAMLRTVFAKTIRDQRRAIAWWSLGFVFFVFTYTAFWPSVHSNAAQFAQYLKDVPQAIRDALGGADYATPAGYLHMELFSIMGPVLLMVYAIGAGARAVAGEEDAGTLDVLLSMPVTRRRVLVEKFGAMTALTLFLAGLVWLSVTVIGPAFDLRVGQQGLAAATINLFLLAMAFGSIAVLAGAATGSRGAAIGIPAGLAVATFVLNTLASTVDGLRPFRFLSPFHYYAAHLPLKNGFDVVDVTVLLAIAVVSLVIAMATFERRDLAV